MILLAGGTGHLGGPLAHLLAENRMKIRVLSRNPLRAPGPQGAEIVAGDVRIRSSLNTGLEGVETVVSAVTGFGPGGSGPRAVDLEGNLNLIDASMSSGVKHFILISIHGARANHPLELYRAKFAAEQRLMASGLAWTIVRPTVFLELWTDILGSPLLKTGTATVFGRGDNPVNFVSVQTVARAVERAVVDPGLRGRTIEVGGTENLTVNDLVQRIAESNGRRAKARHIPLPVLGLAVAMLRPIRPDFAGLLQAAVLMDTTDMTFDAEAKHHEQPRRTPVADVALVGPG
jgi:NADH dehydrogenase